jgi:hypothetical protein
VGKNIQLGAKKEMEEKNYTTRRKQNNGNHRPEKL